MIRGLHIIIYVEDAVRARNFFRDVLGFPSVDAGDGWLIFKSPPGEIAAHPAEGDEVGAHEAYFMCEDIDVTLARLQAQGVEVTSPITDQGWGRLARIRIPGGGTIGIYEPRHPTAIDLH